MIIRFIYLLIYDNNDIVLIMLISIETCIVSMLYYS